MLKISQLWFFVKVHIKKAQKIRQCVWVYKNPSMWWGIQKCPTSTRVPDLFIPCWMAEWECKLWWIGGGSRRRREFEFMFGQFVHLLHTTQDWKNNMNSLRLRIHKCKSKFDLYFFRQKGNSLTKNTKISKFSFFNWHRMTNSIVLRTKAVAVQIDS